MRPYLEGQGKRRCPLTSLQRYEFVTLPIATKGRNVVLLRLFTVTIRWIVTLRAELENRRCWGLRLTKVVLPVKMQQKFIG